MACTVAQLHADLEAARTAISAGSYDTAETQVVLAQTTLAGIPDGEISGSRAEWRDEIVKLLAAINALRTRADAKQTGGRRNYAEFVSPE